MSESSSRRARREVNPAVIGTAEMMSSVEERRRKKISRRSPRRCVRSDEKEEKNKTEP